MSLSQSRTLTLFLVGFGLVTTALFTRHIEVLLLAIPALGYLLTAFLLAPAQIPPLQARRNLEILNEQGEAMPISQALSSEMTEWLVPGGRPASIELTLTYPVCDDASELTFRPEMAAYQPNSPASQTQTPLNRPPLRKLNLSDGGFALLSSLRPGSSLSSRYRFIPQRGSYRFQSVQVTVSDPFNLFVRQETLDAPVNGVVNASLLTLPDITQLDPIRLHPRLLRGFAGPISARMAGSGIDFYGVREFHPGDALRHINWRSSSRDEQRLFTNEFEGERITDVGLFLDARPVLNLRTQAGELFEYGVNATASLGSALLRDGHHVSLLVYGYGMMRVLPSTGRVQLLRILKTLASAKTSEQYALSDLRYLSTRLFPPSSQIIIVSPLSAGDVLPLLRFCAFGYSLMVVSPDPVSFEAAGLQGNSRREAEQLDAAIRLARLERHILLNDLRNAGIQVVNWDVRTDLNQAIKVATQGRAGMPAARVLR